MRDLKNNYLLRDKQRRSSRIIENIAIALGACGFIFALAVTQTLVVSQ
jgi:hypothetical protein